MINIEDDAVKAALLLQKEQPDYLGQALRVYLAGKECHGFVYGVSFDRAKPKDRVFNHGPIDVIIDEDSYVFIKGSRISWVDDDRGRGFLVENPREKSFRGKFFKKQSWQEYLLSRRQKIEGSSTF